MGRRTRNRERMTMSSTHDTQRLHCLVEGRVQGVGFRAFVASNARRLGLTGWVRNVPDGRSVEVVAEGESGRLGDLIQLLRLGPDGARVTGVHESRADSTGEFGEFSVRS